MDVNAVAEYLAFSPVFAPLSRRERIELAGRIPGDEVALAMDPATSELWDDGSYVLAGEGRSLKSAELVDYIVLRRFARIDGSQLCRNSLTHRPAPCNIVTPTQKLITLNDANAHSV